jgi:hypothetical protein
MLENVNTFMRSDFNIHFPQLPENILEENTSVLWTLENKSTILAKTGHGPHSSKFVVICVVLCILCVQMCTELLPPRGYTIAVNKYIIYLIYHIP